MIQIIGSHQISLQLLLSTRRVVSIPLAVALAVAWHVGELLARYELLGARLRPTQPPAHLNNRDKSGYGVQIISVWYKDT